MERDNLTTTSVIDFACSAVVRTTGNPVSEKPVEVRVRIGTNQWSSLWEINRAKRACVTDDLRPRTSRGRKPQPRRFIAGCVMRLGDDKLSEIWL